MAGKISNFLLVLTLFISPHGEGNEDEAVQRRIMCQALYSSLNALSPPRSRRELRFGGRKMSRTIMHDA